MKRIKKIKETLKNWVSDLFKTENLLLGQQIVSVKPMNHKTGHWFPVGISVNYYNKCERMRKISNIFKFDYDPAIGINWNTIGHQTHVKFIIPIGKTSKEKAEKSLRELMKSYREEINFSKFERIKKILNIFK